MQQILILRVQITILLFQKGDSKMKLDSFYLTLSASGDVSFWNKEKREKWQYKEEDEEEMFCSNKKSS